MLEEKDDYFRIITKKKLKKIFASNLSLNAYNAEQYIRE